MRMTFFVAAVLALRPAELLSGDKAPMRTLEDDWKALRVSSWVNEKPEAAWAKLSEAFKKAYGNKGWKKVAVKFYDTPDKLGRGGSKHRVDISFTAAGKEEAHPKWWNLALKLKEDKGARYFVLKGHADVEYQIQYAFKDGRLTLKGTYFSLNPQFSTPAVFDGEFTPVAVKKK